MEWPLSYRPAQFTPAEVLAATELTHALQRSWRSQALLPARTTGHKRYEPIEIAEIRIMVVLRNLGLGLQECRKAAEAAAPSTLFIALMNYPDEAVTVDTDEARGERYKHAIGWDAGERCQAMMAGTGEERSTYVAVREGGYELLPDPTGLAARHTSEAFTVVDLEVVARRIARPVGRPLFTLVVPKSFT